MELKVKKQWESSNFFENEEMLNWINNETFLYACANISVLVMMLLLTGKT